MKARYPLLSLLVLAMCMQRTPAADDQVAKEPRVDVSKSFSIEVPAKLLVASSSEVAPGKPQNPPEPAGADDAKHDIESPTKGVIAAGDAEEPPAPDDGRDRAKGKVERPTKLLVAPSTKSEPISESAPAGVALPHTTLPDNPTVAPGRVKWHDDFATACAAAAESGKPVLLFQLLGNLDDRFC